MTRVPVGRCIAQAYGFLFGRILTIAALSWVAAVFYGALRFGLFELGPVRMPLDAHWLTALAHLAGLLAAILLLAAIAIPLTRLALGLTAEWVLAYFAIGVAELRLFFALIRLYLIMAVAIAATVFAVAGVTIGVRAALEQWPAAAQTGVPFVAIAHWIAAVLAAALLIYGGLRLSFLLYPVAAAEEHASLARVWRLGKGNVLRMLAIVLAFAVPVLMLVFAGEYALMGHKLIAAIATLFTGQPDNTALVALFTVHAQTISIAAAVFLVVIVALYAGASATAYRILTGDYVEETPEEIVETGYVEERMEPHAAPAATQWPEHERYEEPAPAYEEPLPEHQPAETGEAQPQPFDEAYIEPEADVPPEPSYEEPQAAQPHEEPAMQESEPAPAQQPHPQRVEEPVADGEHGLTEDDVWVQEDEDRR